MGRRCVFGSCRNVSGLFPGKTTFHGFPKDADLCRRWVANCCNPDVSAVFRKFGPKGLKQRKICSDHFLETELTTGLCRRLIPGAIPRRLNQGCKQDDVPEASVVLEVAESSISDAAGCTDQHCSRELGGSPDDYVLMEVIEWLGETQPDLQLIETGDSSVSDEVSSTEQHSVDCSMQCEATDGEAPSDSVVLEVEWLDDFQPTPQHLESGGRSISDTAGRTNQNLVEQCGAAGWADQELDDCSREHGEVPDDYDVLEVVEWLDEPQSSLQLITSDDSSVSDEVSWTYQHLVDVNRMQGEATDESVVLEVAERPNELQPTPRHLESGECSITDAAGRHNHNLIDSSREHGGAPADSVVLKVEWIDDPSANASDEVSWTGQHLVDCSLMQGEAPGESCVSISDESKKVKSLRTELRATKRKLFVSNQTSDRRLSSNKKLRQENAVLKKKIKRLNSRKTENEKLGVRARKNPVIHDTLRNASRKPRGRRYHAATMKFAAGTYITGARTYRYIQSTSRLTLPHKNSIYNYNKHIRIGPGINQHLLSKVKQRVNRFKNVQDLLVVISCDGMSIRQDLSYSAKSDEFHGFESDGNYRKCEKNNPAKLASEAVTVMVNGLYKPFKQPIGYMLVHNSPGSDHQWEFITTCVRAVRQTGLIPLVLTMDQCSTNVKMCREHGMTTDAPFVQIDGDQLAIMFDTPHLIKNARNAIFKHNAVFDNKIASYDHLKQLYQKDTEGELRLVPKLVQKAIELPPFVAMSVPMAVRVMSSSTGSGIRHYVNTEELPQEALPTADFVELHDKTFDIFNSKEKFSESIGKPLRMPITDTSTHFDELETILETLKSMYYTVNSCFDVSKARKESKVLTSAQRQPTYLKGLIGNIIALKWLWNILRNKYKCKHMCTNPLCQDCLENFFSEIRRRCGFNDAPNSFHFGCAFKYASISITEKKFGSYGKNCQADTLQPLLTENDFDDYKADRPKQTITITDEPLDLTTPLEVLSKETNALVFILGASVAKIPHVKCKRMLIAKSDDECLLSTDYDFVKVKQSSSARTLVIPNNALYNVGLIAFVAFRQKFRKFLFQQRIGVKTRLKRYINYDMFDKGVCKQCFTRLIDSIYNTLIAGFLKKTRLEQKQANTKKRLLKRNRKANRMNLPA